MLNDSQLSEKKSDLSYKHICLKIPNKNTITTLNNTKSSHVCPINTFDLYAISSVLEQFAALGKFVIAFMMTPEIENFCMDDYPNIA